MRKRKMVEVQMHCSWCGARWNEEVPATGETEIECPGCCMRWEVKARRARDGHDVEVKELTV